MSNQSLANEKIAELITSLSTVTNRDKIEIDWEKLSELRLVLMKGKKTWENAVRIAFLNFMQKQCPDENPKLSKDVIDFLFAV